MPGLKKHIADYFSFTRKERTGIIVVLVLIGLLVFLPFLFPFLVHKKEYDHSFFEKEIAALQQKQADSMARVNTASENGYTDDYRSPGSNYYAKKPAGELFYFDPNSLSADGWKRLGLRDRTIHTIQNYISKGGRFKQPEDIGKIWGLHADEVSRLVPYVRIAQKSNEDPPATDKAYTGATPGKPVYSKSVIDINTADTTAFIALPGIGSKLAGRIISFREKLGGFYKVEQVAETYGLPDSTFQKIKDRLHTSDVTVKKLNINTASIDELKMHPYIRYNIANTIIQYRSQHGNFSSVAELKNILSISGDVFGKMEPYLTVR